MRRVRDYDAELKALEERARLLKARRVEQLGQLVIATGADALDPDTLAGALLDAGATADPAIREAWRAKGAAFFPSRKGTRNAGRNDQGNGPRPGADPAPGGGETTR